LGISILGISRVGYALAIFRAITTGLDPHATILSTQAIITLLQAGQLVEQPTKVFGGNVDVLHAIFQFAAEILAAGVVLLGHRTSKFARRPARHKALVTQHP
jgi:hypothetical protein